MSASNPVDGRMHSPQTMRTVHSAAQPATRSPFNLPQWPAAPRQRVRLWPLLGASFLALATAGPAASPQAASAASPPVLPARTWIVDCANNEALVIQHPDSFLRYRLH